MRKLPAQEEKIRRAIRDIIAFDPLVTDKKLSEVLFDRGFKTTANNPLDRHYVARLKGKLHKQTVHEADNQKLAPRIVEFKEKNRIVFDRLVRIAFYTDDLKKEGVHPPSYREQISALVQIVKLDLAVFNSEMDAGLFERHIGTLEIEKRYRPLPPELKAQMMQAFINWGVIPREHAEEIKNNATDNNKPANDSSTAIVVTT
jgi:hypothetical protein